MPEKLKLLSNTLKILGCGSSSTVPSLACQLNSNNCRVCPTVKDYPKNIRKNTSCLVSIKNKTPEIKNFLFDFPSNISELFFDNNLREIPTLILSHADAFIGLICLYPAISNGRSVNIYTTQRAIEQLKPRFKYMFEEHKDMKNKGYFNLVHYERFNEKFKPLYDFELMEVKHGKTNCLGFRVGDIAYFSDASDFNCFDNDKLRNLKSLIVDCNKKETKQFGHLNEKDVVNINEILKPEKIYITGLSHEIDYYGNNMFECVYDGMEINFD